MSFRIPIGLIPAWAGKTRAHNNTHTEDKAHPRVGGENLLPGYEALKSYGSSPRGRGKLNKDKQIIIKSRLIPAWAGKTPSPGIPCCGSWAHPRVGGENRSCPVGGVGPCGSSPRGRGKPGSRRNARSGHGLIPAWAGKTSIASFSMKATPAHPRVGGENSRPGRNDYYGHGSSPRGRGKLVAAIRDEWGDRLIPAWAGKTCIGHCAIDCHWAHPRVGGENPHPLADARARVGSSPRGRGKRTCAGLAAASSGLIPAWAGKTMPVSVPRLLRTAHPRVGGENFCIEDVILNDTGSSPRGRGKRRVLPRRATRPGLIPAWAGKTSAPAYCRGQGKAHPRVGGENPDDTGRVCQGRGSSPRGRGKHVTARCERRVDGLIPAWAGKTWLRLLRAVILPAHPRVGGENKLALITDHTSLGSSPRGRGKPHGAGPARRRRRLIPAWAGKTVPHSQCPRRNGAHPRVGGENCTRGGSVTGSNGSSPRGRGKLKPLHRPTRPIRLIPAWAGKTAGKTSPTCPRWAHPRVGGENSPMR